MAKTYVAAVLSAVLVAAAGFMVGRGTAGRSETEADETADGGKRSG